MARREVKKPKKPGFLFDEDVPAELADYALYKGYKTLAVKDVHPGAGDHKFRGLLKEWVLVSRDKGWIQVGTVPKKHKGVIVLDAGQKGRRTLITLFVEVLITLQQAGFGIYDLDNRRFLWGDKLVEIAPDGSQATIYPREPERTGVR
jgi:hypothetical protein